ncbi:hypothetical protein PITC_057700 [Penicillium italicum]|uniref:Ankyrin repeat-containing domain-containing protein n=1 Tax=Penicillium italicum TaxID=40296 RepID=A0A0A2KYE3_PENIT|nr:hypothetical protein PITC_057700 [Penicillium italicum]
METDQKKLLNCCVRQEPVVSSVEVIQQYALYHAVQSGCPEIVEELLRNHP